MTARRRRRDQTDVRPFWFDCAIFGFSLFVVFVLCANFSGQQITDNVSTFTSAWAVGQHGTLDISSAPDIKPWTVLVDGELRSDRAPGLIAWASPFYAVLGRAPYPTIFPAGLAAAAATAAAMALLLALLAKLTSRRKALVATLVASFGTATWTISADAIWPHGPDQLWLCSLMLALSCRRPLVAGLAAALALLTRPITAVATAAAGVTLAVRDRRIWPAVKIAATSGLGLAAFLAYNRYAFGHWTLAPGSYHAFVGQIAGRGDRYDPTDPTALAKNVAGALVSPTRGVLALSPFLLILAPGLPAAWRAAPPWVQASALGGLGYAVTQLWANNFAGGAGFYSYRYTIESLTLLSPLLLLCWTEWTSERAWRRRTFNVLALVAVIQHAAGALYITPSLPSGWSSWTHFLFIEAIRQGSWLERAFVADATLLAVLVLLAGTRTASDDDAMAATLTATGQSEGSSSERATAVVP